MVRAMSGARARDLQPLIDRNALDFGCLVNNATQHYNLMLRIGLRRTSHGIAKGLYAFFLRHGYTINIRDPVTGGTPLMAFVQRGDPDAVEAALSCTGDIDVNIRDNRGNTAAHYLMALLPARPVPDRYIQITKKLFDAKVDLMIKNERGETAIDLFLIGRENFKFQRPLKGLDPVMYVAETVYHTILAHIM
jgi:hypothetical protein